jgi:hypothetical protein
MMAARPVNHQNNLSALLLHIGNDLADQDPNDLLLQSHVRRRRVPNRWQILRQAQKNFFTRCRRRLALLIELLLFPFKFLGFLQLRVPSSL